MSKRAAVILAAGKGTRMKSELPKVLHEVAGEPMLGHVLTACRQAGVSKLLLVVGHGAELVQERFADATDLVWVVQTEQRGTGHAVQCCQEHLRDFDGQTLVLCGDGPLIRSKTLATLLQTHAQDEAAITLATAMLDDPAGYGRIVRDAEDAVVAIVEHNDCTPEQLAIREVNPSYYCFDNQALWAALDEIKPNNAKNELYLTDAVSISIDHGKKVTSVAAVQPEEALSINSLEQLAEVNRLMDARMQEEKA